ncbi:DNA methyltransferase [Pedobacter sp. Leaf170]|uniref:DNA methyltransferase n=1 Tax=Pedobacter sp. Leaf170 TaxID=2876558 RepID=UPI001E352D1B|nr:DNA methyltransferase [Pedobacter sp. Leaf170]
MEFIKQTYQDFIDSKISETPKSGFDTDVISQVLFGHQADTVKWAADGGNRAIFASFGMGKSLIQLELCLQALKAYPCGKVLIICPLGVKQEFKHDAEVLLKLQERGLSMEYVRSKQEQIESAANIHITNYERVRDGDFMLDIYKMVTLDEASALRSVASKTYIQFLQKFKNVKHKFVATATPSPNDYIELLNYAAFLGIMDVSQAKTRFFKRDSKKADQLTILPNMEQEFWLWVHSWALFLPKPSYLGYSDEGYDLPELKVHWHCVKVEQKDTPIDDRGQLKMIADRPKGLAPESAVKRESINERIQKALEVIDTESNWLIWHGLERERVAIERAFDCTTVYGNQDDEPKEKLLMGFANGEYKILATKTSIAGSGCNFQKHCHKAFFLGIDHKFNDFIQAIHRIHRFGQKHGVEIHIAYTEQEEHIKTDLLRKWKQHDDLLETFRAIIEKYGLSAKDSIEELKRSKGVIRQEVIQPNFTAINNDNVLEIENRPDNSDDLQITSVPFSTQYEYSANYNDFGHNKDNESFFAQMDFLLPHKLRVLKPGRVSAVHVKDRIIPGNFSGKGMYTTYRFSDKVADAYEKHGFEFMGRICIITDVVSENNQTYRLGWSKNAVDGTGMGVGSSEYILLFRKLPTDTSNSFADVPVAKSKDEYTRARWQIDANGFWRASGNRLLSPEEISRHDLKYAMQLMKGESRNEVYDFDRHVAIAEAMENAGKLPSDFAAVDPQSWNDDVWTDVTRMRGMNTLLGQAGKDQHICPLPFDIVDRLIIRYSNEGETVSDYFAGVFTVPYRSLVLNRKGYGVELNPSYFQIGKSYCNEIEYKKNVPTLFDMYPEVLEAV